VPRTYWRKDRLFTKWHWENWISIYRRMKLDLYLSSYMKVNLKWISNLVLKSEPMKLLEENLGEML
jgi:hypothetical protein